MPTKKARTLISIEPELKEILEQYANEENRSFNNYVVNVLINHVKTKKESNGN